MPIEQITTQRVFDGWRFVPHDGVVCKGRRPVITFAGLTATPDHIVYPSEGHEGIPFEVAAHCRTAPAGIKCTGIAEGFASVYDILNCGPLRRFVADGWQVSNCGYQGSVGAFLRFAPNVAPIARSVREKFFGSDAWRLAGEQFERATNHNGLDADEWISVKIVVNSWREANPNIVQSWWDRQDAAIAAVDRPGDRVDLFGGKVSYLVAEGFLGAGCRPASCSPTAGRAWSRRARTSSSTPTAS